ncbi:hypothetical protein BLNAU_10632 [Blattamonas nauphoetae]|uniref:RRM domain-containing protein n=1 Tax=Blattamonas nauphoetae TaxID=2049346 RepID=A0ABQ9XRT4_9EUKA|nr:hypothetical protein BLNAU_10632 [Blattamonas nauphoetae]
MSSRITQSGRDPFSKLQPELRGFYGVFIPYVPKYLTETDIQSGFSRYGRIQNISLIDSFEPLSDNYAFVHFADIYSVISAVEDTKPHTYISPHTQQRFCLERHVADLRTTLKIGPVLNEGEDTQKHLEVLTGVPIAAFSFANHTPVDEEGYAITTYASHSDALTSYLKLVQIFTEVPSASVNFEPSGLVDPRRLPNETVVWLYNLHPKVTAPKIQALLESLLEQDDSLCCSGCMIETNDTDLAALLLFSCRPSAEKAANVLNQHVWFGRPINARIGTDAELQSNFPDAHVGTCLHYNPYVHAVLPVNAVLYSNIPFYDGSNGVFQHTMPSFCPWNRSALEADPENDPEPAKAAPPMADPQSPPSQTMPAYNSYASLESMTSHSSQASPAYQLRTSSPPQTLAPASHPNYSISSLQTLTSAPHPVSPVVSNKHPDAFRGLPESGLLPTPMAMPPHAMPAQPLPTHMHTLPTAHIDTGYPQQVARNNPNDPLSLLNAAPPAFLQQTLISSDPLSAFSFSTSMNKPVQLQPGQQPQASLPALSMQHVAKAKPFIPKRFTPSSPDDTAK